MISFGGMQLDAEWLKPTEREVALASLVEDYNVSCDSFDRAVCTGSCDGEPAPATGWEVSEVNRHSRETIERLAAHGGFDKAELRAAISRESRYNRRRRA